MSLTRTSLMLLWRSKQYPTKATILLVKHVSQRPRSLILSSLLSFGRPVTPQSILASVSCVQSEIPQRLATRVRSLEALPFIVGTNPYIAKTLEAYKESLRLLARHPPVRTLEENAKFTLELEGLVQSHGNDIPTMAKGFQECSRYMSPTHISSFLDEAIHSRIAIRLIAEQHIAVSQALPLGAANVGVVDNNCSPKEMIRLCGSFVSELCEASLGASPSIVVDGSTEETFPYISVHLEYILTEILKNSFRATVEHHSKLHRRPVGNPLPHVRITISPQHGIPGASFLSMRIRDQGGGVSPSNMARIFSYAFTTAGHGKADYAQDAPTAPQHAQGGGRHGFFNSVFEEISGKGLQTGLGTIAGLGYGLPMSRIYARYFGGSLDLLSLDGWGSDVFLKLRCLDEDGDTVI